MWADIINDFLIALYLLPKRLNGESYLIFLEQMLPKLLQDIPIVIRNRTAPLREIPSIFERVCQLFHRSCQACIAIGGRKFERFS